MSTEIHIIKRTPANTSNDYIPGVTPWVQPTNAELGFIPLSNAEFDKVKAAAAETKEERLAGPYGLGLHKTNEEFAQQLQEERAFIKAFEHDDSPDPPLHDFIPNHPLKDPDYEFHFHYSFEEINNFMKWVLGLK